MVSAGWVTRKVGKKVFWFLYFELCILFFVLRS
jgi:hypothetical protein